jgi:hypothetical protein
MLSHLNFSYQQRLFLGPNWKWGNPSTWYLTANWLTKDLDPLYFLS